MLSYLLLTRDPLGRHYYYPHLPDEETEAQRLNHFPKATKWWCEAEIQAQAVLREGPAPNLYMMVQFKRTVGLWDVATIYVILLGCIWVTSVMPNSVTLWIIAHQAPLSMEFSRQEYWSGLSCPPAGESSQLRNWTCVSCFLHWQAASLLLAPTGKPLCDTRGRNSLLILAFHVGDYLTSLDLGSLYVKFESDRWELTISQKA